MTEPAATSPDDAHAQPAAPEAGPDLGPDAEAQGDAERAAREEREAEALRRRRRDRVFGAVLADTTSDERGESPSDDGSRDAELRRNVPPHHG